MHEGIFLSPFLLPFIPFLFFLLSLPSFISIHIFSAILIFYVLFLFFVLFFAVFKKSSCKLFRWSQKPTHFTF